MSAKTDDEIRNSRWIDVSPEMLMQAFAEPERLARWWGPEGFRNTFHEFAFKPGGHWRFDMHGPDGRDYANHNVFEEISDRRIVIRHLETMVVFTLTITLTPERNGTRIDWVMLFEPPEEGTRMRDFLRRCNEENFDRLESELGRLMGGERELVLRRIIDATPENVYRGWTESELITQWFTPPPYTTPFAELDVRAGGTNRITMRGPDGVEMPNQGVYLEVVPNERLVVTDAFTSAWEPSEKPFMTLILTFEAMGNRTRYTARCRHWSVEDRDTHEKMGFRDGWGVATDQLAALVAKL